MSTIIALKISNVILIHFKSTVILKTQVNKKTNIMIVVQEKQKFINSNP